MNEVPLALKTKRILLLDLSGGTYRENVCEDQSALEAVFSDIRISVEADECDILVIYTDLDALGRPQGRIGTIRSLVHGCKAAIAIVATENPSEKYLRIGPPKTDNRVNLVMTLKRNGPCFSSFLRRLFATMNNGVTIQEAWTVLAPVNRRGSAPEWPETIFVCELGDVVFR